LLAAELKEIYKLPTF